MKECFKCHEVKPLSSFYKHKQMKDGHLNKCKFCAKMDVRLHRSENDSVREYDRKRYHENPERRAKTLATTIAWQKRNPQQYVCNYIVSNAVRDGRLIRQNCENCNSENAHAHHDDYNEPLEVRWLCARCHALHHAPDKMIFGD